MMENIIAGASRKHPDVWETCLHAVIEANTGPAFILDRKFCYIAFNNIHASTMKSIYGTKIAKGMNILKCMTVAEDREKARHNLERVLSRGVRVVEEAFSGDEILDRRCFEVEHVPIRDAGNSIIGIYVVARDITGLRQWTEAASEADMKYRSLFSSIKNGVAVYQAVDNGNDFIITDFNKSACEIEKVRAEDVIGRSVLKVFPGVKSFGLFNVLQEVWKTGKPAYFPVSKYVDERITGWRDNYVYRLPSGEVVAVYEDVTERKQAEHILRESEARYRTIFESVPALIAYIDGTGKIMKVNRFAAVLLGFTPEELEGKSITGFFTPEESRLFIEKNMRVITSGQPVTGAVDKFIAYGGEVRWILNDLAPYFDPDGNIKGAILIGIDISGRLKAEEDLKASIDALHRALESSVNAMAKLVETKDPYTAGHQSRVAELAVAIARELNLPEDRVHYIHTAARLHDIGKIYVPSDILSKPGKLSAIELEIIKTHSSGSYQILKSIDLPGPIALIALQHHERLDGSGYPDGLKGDEIMFEARILAVADVVEAMVSHRPYRPALGIDRALDEITRESGKLYDAEAVATCVRLFTEKNFSFQNRVIFT